MSLHIQFLHMLSTFHDFMNSLSWFDQPTKALHKFKQKQDVETLHV